MTTGRLRRAMCASAVLGSLALIFSVLMPLTAGADPQAAFTTINEQADGSGHCQNGNPKVNCNIYDGADYVWLNGGPVNAALGDGTFFFAVVSPGGQSNPNDG